MNEIRKRVHVLNHSHGRYVVDTLDKILHEGSTWTGRIAIIYFILHFVHHGTKFYEKYITSYDRKKYMDDDWNGLFPKQNVRKLYNEKYQKNYSNQYYFLKKVTI